ncbi:DEAD/DEAH box helicase family protein [Candidatus Woesearchaeota archaeon]|nr:DEAD/DEAH box helicase family protein [Candidatus Woesearchaeota archaeon]
MWSLYQDNKYLKPLVFSNGKTQESIVEEVLDLIEQGIKIIFIKGVCGSGKSAIALNIARELGKTSIVVPGKALQNQYKHDYEGKKYLIKNNTSEPPEKLKIKVITGRKNHKCKYLEQLKEVRLLNLERERNLTLDEEYSKKDKREESADNYLIPCKIEIKEKNSKILEYYLKQNKNINKNEIKDIKDIRRASIAPVCPYWSPVFPADFELNGKNFEGAKKRTYLGIKGKKFTIYNRKPGCSFYEQFNDYIDSDVLIFNSLKYKLESFLGRKPETEVEIIDECDEFLDSFSNEKTINLDRLQNSLNQIYIDNLDIKATIKKIWYDVNEIKEDTIIQHLIFSKQPVKIKETLVYNLLNNLLENEEFIYDIDEESYLLEVVETAKMFEDFFDESYVMFNKKEGNLIVNIITTNLAKRLNEIISNNKRIIMMSGTIHSEKVLKNIFGLDNFKIIEAETEKQGSIEIVKTGLEKDCKYENFLTNKISRKEYLEALDTCVKISEKPTLVHVNSFYDLPSKKEKEIFRLKNLTTREEIIEIQEKEHSNESIKKFKEKEIDILFTTKCSRGIDFPGDQCNSIIFTKYPNPDIKSPFWEILKKTNPNDYWDFYKDKAKRELLQRIYRGLRFKEDHIYLLSPDIRVLNSFENVS